MTPSSHAQLVENHLNSETFGAERWRDDGIVCSVSGHYGDGDKQRDYRADRDPMDNKYNWDPMGCNRAFKNLLNERRARGLYVEIKGLETFR